MSAEAIVAGLVSGILSPLILLWLQHHWIWRTQKRLDVKYAIFQDAVRALSLWSRDAMDAGLQANKSSHKGIVHLTEMRPETVELLEKSKGMVQAFFSSAAYAAYDTALRAHISLDTIPNEDFEQKRSAAIVEMAKELGIAK